MWFDGSLAGLSIWITYCVQVVFAYLTTLCICSFIQNPRARVRMWGCFLFLTIAAWLLLWVPFRAADPVLGLEAIAKSMCRRTEGIG